jgi:hypothetical protein
MSKMKPGMTSLQSIDTGASTCGYTIIYDRAVANSKATRMTLPSPPQLFRLMIPPILVFTRMLGFKWQFSHHFLMCT